jgi:RNA polymerase sigma factor (sigma-70 family)
MVCLNEGGGTGVIALVADFCFHPLKSFWKTDKWHMATMGNEGDDTPDSSRVFATTHWTVVLTSREDASMESDAALENLCRTYWWPLYAFVRRRGHAAHDAQDLTQQFFARLLAKDFLRGVDRSKGKFRSFLLAALEHFLSNEWRRSQTQKRGGKFTFVSINDDSAEQPFLQLPVSNLSPEQVFDQQWAITLLERAVARLQEEFLKSGKQVLFEELKIFLTGEKRAVAYADLAVKLNTSEAALKMTVSRMKKRYGGLLREEIANTVSDPTEIEAELRALFAAWS